MFNNFKKIATVGNTRNVLKSITSIAVLAGAFYGTSYYRDATRPNIGRLVNQISQLTVDKQYHSVRDNDVEFIRGRLTLKPEEIRNEFSVIIGPRGIGKTVAIETAAENIKGIILLVSNVEKIDFLDF